jgi:catechol 2,3-dioxygenase-like lactoylglutathione lyase family enzyme
MATVSVRYIVDDVDAAITFYTERLGFGVEFNPPGFAVLSRGDLRLLLNEPGAGGAGQPMPDGRNPEPGGAILTSTSPGRLRWMESAMAWRYMRGERVTSTRIMLPRVAGQRDG